MAYEWNPYFQYLKRESAIKDLMKIFRHSSKKDRKKEENKMGMVYESEEMQREINDMLTETGNLQLFSTQVNATTALSVCARPLTYDVVLGNKNMVSLNNLENAIIIYRAMMADFKGDIYNG